MRSEEWRRTAVAQVGNEALEAARRHLAAGLGDLGDLARAWADLEAEAARILAASAQSPSPLERAELARDLEVYLPARRAAILSIAASRAGSSAHAAFGAALDVALRVVAGLAKALV